MKYIVLDNDSPIVMFSLEDSAKVFASYLEKVNSGTHYIHVEKCREEGELLSGGAEG